MKVAPYLKTIVASVGTVVIALTAALADNVVSVDETGQLVATLLAAGATVYGVYKVRNKTDERPPVR